MRVHDLKDAEGRVYALEIRNLFVGRWRACRVARDIPGATVIRWPRRWALDDDAFCRFTLDGVTFVIVEPFGDNSRYWVGAEPSRWVPQFAQVRDAFARAPLLDWRLGAAG